MFRRIILIIFIFWNAVCFAADFGTRKVGIEFEFDAHGSAQKQSDVTNYSVLLNIVKTHFGGKQISIRPWNKYSNAQNTFYGFLKDDANRVWNAVPELTLSGQFDGYELITPPLTSAADIEKTKAVLRDINTSNLFSSGPSTSTHYTFDVSDLVSGDNVSRVVDLILYLENNMLEIYKSVQPNRYQHVVNRFAVPLGINQKDLLNELAGLSYEERTFNHVKAIFEKYESRELALTGSYARVWKFRAFNYGKFFGLASFQNARIPVVECRLADSLSADNMVKLGEFYTALIEEGSKQHQGAFVDPFPKFTSFTENSPEHLELDSFIKRQSIKKYTHFLQDLGFKQNYFSSLSQNSCSKLYH